MAINVNSVYKTVLSILNKEQRGNITPDEFNKIANLVQLDIFERYFDDLTQQVRVPQTDREYSNRVLDVDEKIARFKVSGSCKSLGGGVFKLPVSVNGSADPNAVHKLGVVTYENPDIGGNVEIERLTSKEFFQNQRSNLTRSSKNFPTYIYEGETSSGNRKTITVSPDTIDSGVFAYFVRKPNTVMWASTGGTLGQLLYDQGNSKDFELHPSETVNIITRILLYSGVVISDPQVVQLASSKIQADEINQKS